MNFNEFLIKISKIKNTPLLGEASQFKMAPPFRQQLIKQQKKALNQPRKAAVLALFYPDKANETHFVLILRKTYQGVHSAQVSFPGGKFEATDSSLKETALRETKEEVGVAIDRVEVLKTLTPIYIPPSHFNVQPFLGVIQNTLDFELEASEVESIIEIPLLHFLDDRQVVTRKVQTSYNLEVEVPAFLLNDHVVWGATAMILSEIKDLMKQLF